MAADYLRNLTAKTQRDDTALLALGPIPLIDEEDSLALLRALAAVWPLDRFDEVNIGTAGDRRLRRALAPIGPRYGRVAGGPYLLPKSQHDVRRWLLSLVGREVGGARLTKDPLGWFEFAPVGRSQ